MSERSKRMRRQISDVTDDFSDPSEQESGDDFDPRKSDGLRRAGKNESLQVQPTNSNSRSKRQNAHGSSPTTVQRLSSGAADDRRQSIKLTMKVAPSKLREVMRANEVEALQDTLGGGKVLDGPRSTRRAAQARVNVRAPARPKYAEYGESDLEDEDDEEDAEEDPAANDFDELGAEAEGGTDEEDIEMEDAPPTRKAPLIPKAPRITLKTPVKSDPKQTVKPKLQVTPADVGPVQPVEDQEMEDDPDDDEVENSSDLTDDEDNDDEEEDEEEDEENGEDEEDEEDQTMMNQDDTLGVSAMGEEIDAEGEDEEVDGEEDDGLADSGDDTAGSGTGTPDPGKLTNRQRGRPGEALMALDMAPQQRKFFTDQEKAMKKDEHARKRKELTKRKTQEEKTAALNRLLKPQVSKTRGAAPKADTLAAQLQAAAEEEEIQQRADSHFTRWVSTKDGIKLGVPDEWLGTQVGKYFGPPPPPKNGRLIQEIS